MRIMGWQWLVIGLLAGAGVEWFQSHSIQQVNGLHALQGLPTPSEVMLQGVVSHLQFNRLSWVFDLENAGKITCYWRHPPQIKSFGNGDFIRIRARMERTPDGLLCIVQERVFDAS